ncbi:MAG: hypothetical protein ABSD30_22550 [Candidatus Binatus sp.]
MCNDNIWRNHWLAVIPILSVNGDISDRHYKVQVRSFVDSRRTTAVHGRYLDINVRGLSAIENKRALCSHFSYIYPWTFGQFEFRHTLVVGPYGFRRLSGRRCGLGARRSYGIFGFDQRSIQQVQGTESSDGSYCGEDVKPSGNVNESRLGFAICFLPLAAFGLGFIVWGTRRGALVVTMLGWLIAVSSGFFFVYFLVLLPISKC